MANMKFRNVVTAKGTAIYPHLRKTEVFDNKDTGKYTCGIRLNKEATDKLVLLLDNEWEMAKKTADFEDKRFSKNSHPVLGYHEDKNGDIIFKAKTNAVIKTRTGEVIERTVGVFDAKGKPLPVDMEVGNGSIIRMSFDVRPFYVSSNIYGLQLLLKGVQVVDYKPVGTDQTAEGCGFATDEEGFEVNKPASPFEDSEDSGDF